MKPPPFDYLRPDTLEEALEALAELGDDAAVLAGGQSLLPMLNFRVAAPAALVDIGALDELGAIRLDGDRVEIGAAVTQAELLAWPGLERELPLLALALPWVGHFQTRNHGTVCGSLAHADPSAELPLCLAALGGEVELRSQRGTRWLGADAFQTGILATARAPDEMIVAVRFPHRAAGAGHAFEEVARRHGDFAIVALAARADRSSTRLAVGGVAERPAVRELGSLAGADLDEALNAFAWELGGEDDVHASARYRRELVRRLGPGVVADARGRCA